MSYSTALNRITIIGYACGQPVQYKTKNGYAVARFSVAVNRDYQKDNGQTAVDFFVCEAWNALAPVAVEKVQKGDLVYVDGPLQFQTSTTGGVKKVYHKILINALKVLRAKRRSAEAEAENYAEPEPVDIGSVEW